MNRRLIPFLAIAAIAVACVSCEDYDKTYKTYVVSVTPADSGADRQITLFRTLVTDSGPRRVPLRLERAQADRLDSLYGERPDSADTEFVVRRRFATIPDDIGNHGEIHRYDSPIGTARIYAERIRGNPDLLSGLEGDLAAADTTIDFIVGWLGSELGDHPRWPALRERLDGDLRRTYRNLALQSWLHGDDFQRLSFTWFEHPLMILPLLDLGEDLTDSDSDEDTAELRSVLALAQVRLRAAMAEALEVTRPAEVDRTLHFLASTDTAYAHLIGYIARTTGGSEESARARWKRLQDFTMTDVISLSSPSRLDDSIQVRLAIPRGWVGVDTDGRWDEDSRTVVWSGRTGSFGEPSARDPVRCYASWARPDTVGQKRLFGRVALDADKLTIYCIWFASLDPTSQAEWNAMLSRLRPGKLERLKKFSFSARAGGGAGAGIPGRTMILNAMQ
jgi:hypothetical protein